MYLEESQKGSEKRCTDPSSERWEPFGHMEIGTEDLGSALKIFETINQRGVGLNAMDLTKNLLFIQRELHPLTAENITMNTL